MLDETGYQIPMQCCSYTKIKTSPLTPPTYASRLSSLQAGGGGSNCPWECSGVMFCEVVEAGRLSILPRVTSDGRRVPCAVLPPQPVDPCAGLALQCPRLK